jgi:hypothetical protein
MCANNGTGSPCPNHFFKIVSVTLDDPFTVTDVGDVNHTFYIPKASGTATFTSPPITYDVVFNNLCDGPLLCHDGTPSNVLTLSLSSESLTVSVSLIGSTLTLGVSYSGRYSGSGTMDCTEGAGVHRSVTETVDVLPSLFSGSGTYSGSPLTISNARAVATYFGSHRLYQGDLAGYGGGSAVVSAITAADCSKLGTWE